eukprot:scaffold5093_cov83-Skeletonema_marinoi.AAC.1
MVKWLGDGVRGKIDWTLFLVTSEAGAGDTLKSLSSPLSPGGRGEAGTRHARKEEVLYIICIYHAK